MFPWNLFPFDKEVQSKVKNMKPEEINQFVQNIMGKVFQPSFPNNMNPQEMMKHFQGFPYTQTDVPAKGNSKINYSVFETHDNIFVRIILDSEDWLTRLKLSHTSHLLLLENIPEQGNKHSIPLPSLVKKKGTTANFKDNTLEIKIPKDIDTHYSEINVTELL
ncbi:Hsp20/alpha crystallin family protein [Niallia oryzisoli]|uniref:Hsp20/alpha crystallin family protein n=1 Tax=Niallia oryzisoli TaxID=1737571 RepID=UPI00373542C6